MTVDSFMVDFPKITDDHLSKPRGRSKKRRHAHWVSSITRSAIQPFNPSVNAIQKKSFTSFTQSHPHVSWQPGNPSGFLPSKLLSKKSRFLTSPWRRPTRQHRHQNGKSTCRCPRIPQTGTPRYASALLDDSPTLEAVLAHLQGRKSPTACPVFSDWE